MPSILINHAIKMLANKSNPVTHLLTKGEINLLFSHWGLNKEDTKQLLNELKEQGHVRYKNGSHGIEVVNNENKR